MVKRYFWQRSTQKYPHFLILNFGVEDFIKIHLFDEPVSGTCDLIIAFESDCTNADFRFNSLFFDYLC